MFLLSVAMDNDIIEQAQHSCLSLQDVPHSLLKCSGELLILKEGILLKRKWLYGVMTVARGCDSLSSGILPNPMLASNLLKH